MNDDYEETMRWLSARNFPVVYSTRNILDVKISEHKHSVSGSIKNGVSVCGPNEKKCIAAEKAAIEKNFLNVTTLFNDLIHANAENAASLDTLHRYGVNVRMFTYEELMFSAWRTRSWTNLMNHIDPKHRLKAELTSAQLVYPGLVEIKTPPLRKTTVANYGEIVSKLRNTEWEFLLEGDYNVDA